MWNRYSLLGIIAAVLVISVNWLVFAQPPIASSLKAQPTVVGDRFEFEIAQSFIAKYEGDTPGHSGRNGGLGERRPRVAIGDPVFRDKTHVGRVTEVGWSRTHGTLEIEFAPLPGVRTCVGDQVWLWLNGPPEKQTP